MAMDAPHQPHSANHMNWQDPNDTPDKRARWACCTLLRRLETGIARASGVNAWLAVHDGDHTSHVVYRFEDPADNAETLLRELTDMAHPHVLEVESYDFDLRGRLRIKTPYTGNQQQWIRLSDVLGAKGGQLPAAEAERAVAHLLAAVAHAHKRGLAHGDLGLDRVLVDRHGCVLIELYGVDRAVAGLSGTDAELRRDEIRSIASIAYTLLTGIEPSEPLIAAGHLVGRLSPAWDHWLARALDPSDGFDTAAEAIDFLPANQPLEPTPPSVRVVRRVLRSLGSTR